MNVHHEIHVVVATRANPCTLCGVNVEPGEQIVWYKPLKGFVAHLTCALQAIRKGERAA